MSRSSSQHEDSNMNDKTLDVKRTAPISKVVELEPRFRTRYVAWAGLILLWMASLTAVLMRGDATEWLLLSSLSLVIICSGLLPLLGAYGLSYTRALSSDTVEHGMLSITIKLHRKFPLFGVWYAVQDQLHNVSSMRGQKIKLKAWFMPLFHREMELSYQVLEMERGNYEAHTAIIVTGDWLGLTCITRKLEVASSCVALPLHQEPEEESYVARHTSTNWMKRSINSAGTSLHQKMTLEQFNLRQKQEMENGSHDWQSEGVGIVTRPYAAGDSYRRIDNRAAARGLGLHTRMSEADDMTPKLCFLLDQYDLPYEEEQQDQLFDSLVSWCLADVCQAGEEQNVSVLCDDWSFQYSGQQNRDELKYLLALARPDVTMQMKDRISNITPLLPSRGQIIVYSGAWKDSEGWLALAEAAWLKGSRLELQFVTTNRVMTYAMREQQKVLEAAGIQLVWRYSVSKPASVVEVKPGGESYAKSR